MQRALAEAVLATFHNWPQLQQREILAQFSEDEWREGYRWLDASGLALYFLDYIKRLRWEAALPPAVLARLERNLEDNRVRTANLFEEFARINRELIDAGARFVNVKGVTLAPDACPDPTLRHQVDLDFLVDEADVDICCAALERIGYVLSVTGPRVREFKAGASCMPSIDHLYKPKPQRSAEIHLEESGTSTRLKRKIWRTWDGFCFPALCESEAFLLQAGHLFKHLGDEWMRMSWVLEFRHSILSRHGDTNFWAEVRGKTEGDTYMRTAIGAGIALATQAFGDFASSELLSWTVDVMQRPMHLWLGRYSRTVIFAGFPGTKLYLLLPQPQRHGETNTGRSLRQILLPLHLLPFRMVIGQKDDRFFARMQRWSAQMGYAMIRLRFHAVEGARYLLESRRWRKIVGTIQ